MNKSSSSDFSKLPMREQQRYRAVAHQMTTFARDHAIPITFAPPFKTLAIPLSGGDIGAVTVPLSLGKIDGATGCVMQLQSDVFVVTAEHVLKKYEERLEEGEVLNWQVGNLPPFDPRPRVAWRGGSNHRPDIVFLSISEQEAEHACAGRTHIISASTGWPPSAPQVGKAVLLVGFPNTLREIDNLFRVTKEVEGAIIKAGSLSAMLRVTTTGEGYFKCRFEYAELLSFDEQPLPLTQLNTNIGGLSGGPVFEVDEIVYPFVGVISQRFGFLEDSDVVVIAALDGLPSSFVGFSD